VLYVTLGVVANLHAFTNGLNTTLNGGVGGDGGQDLWFLSIVAHNVAHGHIGFYSNLANYPRGINLSDMTSMPLLGLLASPLVLLVGPIFAYNVCISLCFATAGFAMYLAARRFTDFEPAALLAGLAYAFSPYMIGQGQGHLFLIATALFPLWLILGDEILVRQRWSERVSGVLLGIVIVAQVYLAVEPAVSALLLTLAALVVLWLCARRSRSEKAPYAIKATALGAVVASPFMLWFGYSYFLGKAHGKGDVRSAASVKNLSSSLASFVTPGSNQRVHFGFAHFADSLVNFGIKNIVADPPENAAYIGIPLLVLLVAGIWWQRRDRRVQLFGGLFALSLLMSMGSFLRLTGTATKLPLPFWVFAHLPVLKSTISIRWNLFAWLFLAVLLAIIIGQVAETVRQPTLRTSKLLVATTTSLVALSIVSLIPALPYNASPAVVPAYFTSNAAKTLPSSTVMVTYPLAVGGAPLPMLWQAMDSFRFHLIGGEVGSQAMDLGATRMITDACMASPTLTPDMSALLPEMRQEFKTWGVTLGVLPLGYAPNEQCGENVFTAVFGSQPQTVDNAYVWTMR